MYRKFSDKLEIFVALSVLFQSMDRFRRSIAMFQLHYLYLLILFSLSYKVTGNLYNHSQIGKKITVYYLKYVSNK